MVSLHYITHAVTLAVIATLVKKYLQLQYAYEELEVGSACHGQEDLEDEILGQPRQAMTTDPTWRKDPTLRTNPTWRMTHSADVSTSLWCSGQNRSDRICDFRNLCYNGKNRGLVFIHGERNVLEGVDLETIHDYFLDLSSVRDHTVNVLRLVDLPTEALDEMSVHWVQERSLLFNRFKPDNIMHALHDDIFPLHHTLEIMNLNSRHSSPPFDVRLVFLENWEVDEFKDIYNQFTTHEILDTEKLSEHGELTCFTHGRVGISKSSTWYQYGFDSPQGPLDNSIVTSYHIHNTVQYLLSNCKDECDVCYSGDYFVLVSRKENRLILNEPELVLAIAQETGLKVVVISYETHNMDEMMKIVHGSRGVIGMHGSMLVLSAFLKPNSIVLELYPYAVNPKNYTPFKTLCEIPGMNLVYKTWANMDRNSSVMHPGWSRELGGILSLTNEEQENIIHQKEVPKHTCCEDPSWLFHIYQDTRVDIPSVLNLLKQYLSESAREPQTSKPSLLPGPVLNVQCDVTSGNHGNEVVLSWEPPWNMDYLSHSSVEYEIWVQDASDEHTKAVIVGNVTTQYLTSYVTLEKSYNVWIRSVLNTSILGQFSGAIKCLT